MSPVEERALERAILSAIDLSTPTTMLDVVDQLPRYSENDVRMTVWKLIGEQTLRLRHDRKLVRLTA